MLIKLYFVLNVLILVFLYYSVTFAKYDCITKIQIKKKKTVFNRAKTILRKFI